MQDEVLAHGFAESYRTRVKTWLNTAQARVANDIEVSEKFSSTTVVTAVGNSQYSAPANNTKIQGIVDEQLGFPLDYIKNPDTLMATNASGTFNGRPQEYSFSPVGIIFSPVPDAVYTFTVLFYLRPVDLSADGDVSTLPADFHDVMCSWALHRAYRSEDDAQMSQFYYNEYDRDMKLLGSATVDKTNDPTQVPGTWAF